MAVYILTEFNSKSAVSKKIFYTRPKFNDIIDSLDFYDSD